jgi:hypothetical protein
MDLKLVSGLDDSYLFSTGLAYFQGHILCASFCPDVPLVVAVGGQKNGLKVRNLAETAQGN